MPPAPPSIGTVTFMFTDIEGSTKLWEASPDTMRGSLALHDELVRGAVEASNGQVFKTIGDAFCAAFPSAAYAVEAALSAQLILNREAWPAETPIKVRMALHTGVVESRDGDYFGPPLNRVARLLAAAHGAQVVLSRATYEIVLESLPAEVTLKDLGAHLLKDLSRAEHMYQLLHPALPCDFPPLHSLSTHPNNLPQQLTSFVGRDKEATELADMLLGHRLITLTGSGGTGKSRIALQVAAETLERYPDGAWLVELAPIMEGDLVVQTIGQVLSVKAPSDQAVFESIVSELREKKGMILLDNCEHVLDPVAAFAERLLTQCPRMTILATSREGLGLPGERTYRIPSLRTPDADAYRSGSKFMETMAEYDAVNLFVDRALDANANFVVTPTNAAAIGELCQRLDGIPLAIELAAARTATMTVEEILQRLDKRFRLLTGGSRTALPRQKTLRALVDWSYDLLSDAERRTFRVLSVFTGGWTLAQVEGLSDSIDIDDLSSLVNKSLVIADTAGNTTRYHFLQTVREYAAERLVEGGEAEQARDWHLASFRAIAKEVSPHLGGPDQRHWLEAMHMDLDNLRTALDWSLVATESAEVGLGICVDTYVLWWIRGYWTEARSWLDALLARSQRPSRIRGRALNCAGHFALYQGDYDVAKEHYEQAREILNTNGEGQDLAQAHHHLGHVHHLRGEAAEARSHYERSLDMMREIGETRNGTGTMNNLANLLQEGGEYDAAKELHLQALEIRRELGSNQRISQSLQNLGNLSALQSDYVEAERLWTEALTLSFEISDVRSFSQILDGFAESALAGNDLRRCATLVGAAASLRSKIGSRLHNVSLSAWTALVAEVRTRLGDDEFTQAWEVGELMSMEQACRYAIRSEASPLTTPPV